jgi:LDH2 family malate/lactate/ureidoglycolate dehydrogenase
MSQTGSEVRETVLVPAPQLRDTITEIFLRVGVSEDEASREAEILVDADLRGVDTHGMLLVPRYVAKFKGGAFNPAPSYSVVSESPSTFVLDGDNGLGHVAAAETMARCIEKARETGVCFGGLRNSNHAGCMGYYVIQAADADMIGYAVTDTHSNLAPFGGTQAMLGNNPFAVGIPAGDELPIVLDMALSVAAKAKVIRAAAKGEPIPEGWVTDKQGNPITDPELIVGPVEKRVPFLLAAVGGVKGSGMLIVNTILAGILTGTGSYGPHLPSFGSQFTEAQYLGSLLGAIDISHFVAVGQFKANVGEFIAQLKASDKAPGVEEIFMPGEIEAKTKQRRLEEGIPVVLAVWDELQSILSDLAG